MYNSFIVSQDRLKNCLSPNVQCLIYYVFLCQKNGGRGVPTLMHIQFTHWGFFFCFNKKNPLEKVNHHVTIISNCVWFSTSADDRIFFLYNPLTASLPCYEKLNLFRAHYRTPVLKLMKSLITPITDTCSIFHVLLRKSLLYTVQNLWNQCKQ